jgi:hypothetical protein
MDFHGPSHLLGDIACYELRTLSREEQELLCCITVITVRFRLGPSFLHASEGTHSYCCLYATRERLLK